MFIKPWPSGPSSVHSRSAPRGSVTRRQAPWQARSHAGAAQNPCAAAVCASLLLLYPIEPGGGAPGFTCLAQGPLTNCPGDPLARIRPSLDDHVAPGHVLSSSSPHVPTRAAGIRGDTSPSTRPRRALGLRARARPTHDPTGAAPTGAGGEASPITSTAGRRDRRGYVTIRRPGPP
jgi:hypothetical protein